MTTPGSTAGKDEWRAWARSQREDIDWAGLSKQILDHLRNWDGIDGRTRVVLFDPLPDEADVTPLADRCVALLTRTDEDGLTVHAFGDPREQHRLGFSQPIAESPVVDPVSVDVVLAPGLAFDRHGVRLGRGGGHYDRLLALLRPDAVVVGVAPAALVVDRLPREDHDRRVTHLVTEEGIASVGASRAAAASVVEAARAWIAGDPDPVTRGLLQDLIDRRDAETLRAVMGTPLRFGTAGIRGEVGPGSSRMNRATVIRVTRGIVDYLAERGRGDGTVVVGFDARPDSRTFADDVVGVFAAAGMPVRFFPDPVPTPLVAHQALKHDATMAIVVTASHNPPADNGYKVYDANGAQIVPPVDADIARAIDRVGPANEVPRLEGALDSDPAGVTAIGAEAAGSYLDDLFAFRGDPPEMAPQPLVFTPLHGVSGDLLVAALERAGHTEVTVVPEQFEPDGTFPTVAFPNPEEEHSLDLAEHLAEDRGIDLVLASDPDGDRLGVSLRDGGTWRRLTGNEIGVLLADFVLERTGSIANRVVVSSIVSSPMLASIARAHDAHSEYTLTGFKWICNAALDLEAQGYRFVFGFEEALGYAVGTAVRDKDGISAAVWFADLAAVCAAAGETVLDRLARLYAEHGLWVCVPRSIARDTPDGLAELAAGLSRLVSDPPDSVGGLPVERVVDYRTGGEGRPRWLADAPLVALELGGGSRVLARPSGTEPKMKIYTDLRSTVTGPEAVAASEAEVEELAARVAADVAGLIAGES
ncbi:MAG TPA: 5-formyltetrahydrofolate cyclo-ligase [Acidimicrobiia bacterium]|nr:5-formyltetrahydrofolate cyclo-ligase [Acidimicrobiia bacterium]